jgi:hypothetical protein
MLVSMWVALAASGLLLAALRLLVLRRRFAALPACTDARLESELSELARRAGVGVPSVVCSETAGSALVLAPARLCLPAWALTDLSPAHRRAMLAHEIAHVARRDPWWRIGHLVICRALFFQPLNYLASRRLEALAELACDAWAAQAGNARALAECLAACAEHVQIRDPEFAVAMARRHSPLLTRIQTLLEEVPMRNRFRALCARLTLATLAPAMLLLPALTIERVAVAAAHSRESIEISDSWLGHYFSADIDVGDGRLQAKFKGKFQFSDSEDDVAQLDDNGWIEETRGKSVRRIEYSHGGDGIKRRYIVDGSERPLDADGKQWLARVIPALIRESGYDAEARVARIQARGGSDAVLAEIALIHGNYARRVYLVPLAKHATLTAPQLTRAIELALAIDGDYERREALTALIEHQTLEPAHQVAILDGVAHMDGDYEQRVVLCAIAPKLGSDAAVVAAWRKAVSGVGSDYEKRVAIAPIAKRKTLEPALLEAALSASGEIKSDYEARVALTSLAAHISQEPALGRVYAASAAKIDSGYERREALAGLLRSARLDPAGYRAVLDAAAGIDSDYECRVLLVEIAQHMPGDAALIARYREVARKLGDYERGQAEKALDRFAAL